MSAGDALLFAADVVATLVVDYKWLRVAQREHYQPGRVTAIAAIWTGVSRSSRLVGAGTVLLFLAAVISAQPVLAAVLLAVVVATPLGLSIRPRTAPLAFTPRMRRLAGIVLVLDAVILGGVGWELPVEGVIPAVAAIAFVDAALWLARPIETRLSRTYVTAAKAKLARVRPQIVAITGSYGKTSTKAYAAQLIGAARSVAASPASFNNLMGLSRAVNDRLPEGADVFVAEMGTYGPGEIRALCEIFTPDVSAIITIGEAHLERMKNRATIVAAKSEITERPGTVVLNVDVPELKALADRLDGPKRVLRVSTSDTSADAAVLEDDGRWVVHIGGHRVADVPAPATGHPVNLAVAAGLALAVGVPTAAILRALPDLPTAAHRAEIATTPEGVTVVDDTYNANPTGAAQAVAAARELAGEHRVFTVTPGMIELGARQAEANTELARQATDGERMRLAVVGRTNRVALLAGARAGSATCYRDRATAAREVMAQARAGDVVVFENDLPDHYP